MVQFHFLDLNTSTQPTISSIRSDEEPSLETSEPRNPLRWVIYTINPVDKNKLFQFSGVHTNVQELWKDLSW